MRGRTALLLAGGAVLLVLLVVMKTLLAGDDAAPAVAAPAAPRPTAAPTEAAPAPAAPNQRSARIPKPTPVRPAAPVPAEAPEEPRPRLAPPAGAAAASTDDEPKSTVPIANKPQLRDAMNAVEPAVRACIDQHGRGISGAAVLTWSVVSKSGKSVVESTGVDYDETTVEHPPLLECLHKTAEQMQFAPAPGNVPVSARRRVAIENGQLTEQTFLSFSRIY